MSEKKRLAIPVALPADCEIRAAAGEARRLVLLLHGYAETAHRMMDKLGPALPADATAVAINGCFPVPEINREKGEIREGYAWYFYDPRIDEYRIDMATAVAFVSGVVERLGLAGLPCSVVGFSQGGYLAPFVAQRLPGARQVIGIGSRYLDEEISGALPFRVDAVHGAEDRVVEAAGAAESHRKLLERGARGELALVPGAAHRITPEIAREVARLLGLA